MRKKTHITYTAAHTHTHTIITFPTFKYITCNLCGKHTSHILLHTHTQSSHFLQWNPVWESTWLVITCLEKPLFWEHSLRWCLNRTYYFSLLLYPCLKTICLERPLSVASLSTQVPQNCLTILKTHGNRSKIVGSIVWPPCLSATIQTWNVHIPSNLCMQKIIC